MDYRLDQLTAELKTALPSVPFAGLTWSGETYPYPTFTEPCQLSLQERATFIATCDAHVPDPYWGEDPDTQLLRDILTDADATAYLSGTPTAAQTVVVVRKIIRALRAVARKRLGEPA